MHLLCDIGNSRVKIAVFDKDENPVFYTSCEHNIKEIIETFYRIKDAKYDFKNIYYVSVAKKINDMFQDSVNIVFKKDALNIIHKDILLKKNNYTPRESVGIDRLLSTYASVIIENKVKKQTKKISDKYVSVVVDMGSASTISVMTSDFEFLGGMVMPGMKTSYKALSDKTSLPFFDVSDIKSFPNAVNNNVEEGLISGMVHNAIGAIEFAVNRTQKQIKELYGLESKIFLTGGFSNMKLTSYDVYPYLVLQGVYFIVKNM